MSVWVCSKAVYVRLGWPVKSGRFFLAFMIRCPCFSVASLALSPAFFHYKARGLIRGRRIII